MLSTIPSPPVVVVAINQKIVMVIKVSYKKIIVEGEGDFVATFWVIYTPMFSKTSIL